MPFIAAAMPVIAMVAGIAGTGVSMLSSIASGNAQAAALKAKENEAKYNQDIAKQNSQIMQANAEAVNKSGAYQEELQRKKNLQLQGTAEANIGASGVTMSGTPLEIMTQNAQNMEQDILASRYNTAVKANQYKAQANIYTTEAANLGSQAEAYGSAAGPAASMGYLGAGTTLLGNSFKMFGAKQYSTSGTSGRL